MAHVLEIHKALVNPENAQALLELRPRLIEAVRTHVPGFVSATLVRVDDRTWIDLIEWESDEARLAAPEVEMQLPETLELMSLIQEPLSSDIGEVAHSSR
jgi:hypothetical protein